MSFLNPWAIMIGAFALATPLIVHVLTRPRPRPQPLSTISLVYEAIKQRRSRHRLRDFLVLLLRVLAIAMIAAAIARPMWQTSVIETADSDVEVARVIVVDVSQSMQAGSGGNQPIARARAVTHRYLQQQKGLVAGLIFAGARPESVFDQLSGNLAVMRQSLKHVDVKPQSADALAAINQAADLLSQTDESMKREVVVVSDFQRTDWGAVRFDALPSDTAVQLESVALPRSNNLAVLAVRTPPRVVTEEAFACEVEVGNFSDVEQPLRCALRIGEMTATAEHSAPPGQSTITFPLQIDSPGWRTGVAQLLGASDDLQEDDLRPCVLNVSAKPSVILLSNQNRQLVPSSGYYLERAISFLVQQRGKTTRLQRLRPRELTAKKLDACDVLVIDHPGRLQSAKVKEIARSLSRGCGVLYFVSDLADGVNVRAISQELGAAMQLPVNFVPPAGRRARRDLSVMEVSRREEPFGIFGDALDSAFADVRIGGGLGTKQTEQALKDRILAKLSDRSALLAVSDAGSGKIGIVNADLEQSNLAVRPPFVPLLGELISSLLPNVSSETESACGQQMVRLLPPSISLEDHLEVQPADNWPEIAEGYGTWEASPTGVMWNWPNPSTTGAFTVQRGKETTMAVAITTPPGESDLAPLDAATINISESDVRAIGFRDTRDANQENDHWWNWLLVACSLGLISEVLTLRIFQT